MLLVASRLIVCITRSEVTAGCHFSTARARTLRPRAEVALILSILSSGHNALKYDGLSSSAIVVDHPEEEKSTRGVVGSRRPWHPLMASPCSPAQVRLFSRSSIPPKKEHPRARRSHPTEPQRHQCDTVPPKAGPSRCNPAVQWCNSIMRALCSQVSRRRYVHQAPRRSVLILLGYKSPGFVVPSFPEHTTKTMTRQYIMYV